MTQPTERRFVMEPRLDAEVQALEAVDATKAPLASPALTGTPTAPTAAVDTSTTQVATTAFVTNQAASATSPMNGTAAVGTSKRYARQDHVHPTDTTRAPLASPTFTGTPAGPTAAADTNTTQLATTAFVAGQASSTSPVMDGTATVGTSLKYARADHVHPSDTSRAPAAGSSSITTVGTITSGTWNATDIALGAGGTNASLTAVNGGVVYSNSTAMAITAAGTQDQVLKSNGAAAPTWQTLDLTYLPDAAFKKSVKAATTANITLSAPQTIDGIALVAGDRVLVKNQTAAADNGIYVVQAAGWTRATDADSISEIAGAIVNVDAGTQGAQLWTNNLKTTDTLGTTAMAWYRVVDTSYTIPVSQGGTGRTTLTANSYLKGNGTSQVGMQTGIPVADITGLNLDSLSDVVITSPSAGQTLAYNGTNWINGSGGGGGVTASATAPASPVNGSAWFDTNDGTLYVYYTDANSSQWVEVQADSALGSQLATRMSTAETGITSLRQVSPSYVNSQAARDALYPSPVQGNTVFRNDLGVTERYYALYNASTNPGGATPAGWYPDKAVQTVRRNNVDTNITGGQYNGLYTNTIWTQLSSTRNIAAYNGGFTVPFTGIWNLSWNMGGTNYVTLGGFLLNSTTQPGSWVSLRSIAHVTNSGTGMVGSASYQFSAGDRLYLFIYSNTTYTWSGTVSYADPGTMKLEFVDVAR